MPAGTRVCDSRHAAGPVPQCLYFFGLSFVPFEEAVTAIGHFLADWLKDKGYDGVCESYPPLPPPQRATENSKFWQ